MNVSLRDYYAATADVSWLPTASIEYIAAKSGANAPPDPPTDQQLANFMIKAEIKWRFKYADLMLKGKD